MYHGPDPLWGGILSIFFRDLYEFHKMSQTTNNENSSTKTEMAEVRDANTQSAVPQSPGPQTGPQAGSQAGPQAGPQAGSSTPQQIDPQPAPRQDPPPPGYEETIASDSPTRQTTSQMPNINPERFADLLRLCPRTPANTHPQRPLP